MAMPQRVGRAVLELVGDHRGLTKDLHGATSEILNFQTKTQRTYKDVAAGMAFAGKQASASSLLIAGMGRAGQQAAQQLAQAKRPVDALAHSTGAAGKEASVSGRLFAGMGKSVVGVGKDILTTAAGFITAKAAIAGVHVVTHLLVDEFKHLALTGSSIASVADNFDRMTERAGQLGSSLLGVLREGTHRTIDDFELMKTVNQNLAAGMRLTEDQWKTLTAGAFALAQATGGSVKDGLDTMNDAMLTGRTRAIAMLTGKIDVEKAERRYAATLDTTREELTETGQLEAARVAILEAVARATSRLGVQTDGLNEKADQARVKWKNFHDELARTVASSPVIAAAFEGLSDALTKAFGPDQSQQVAGIARKIDELAIASIGAAQALVTAAGVSVKGWHEFNKFIGTSIQAIYTLVGASLLLKRVQLSFPNAVGLGGAEFKKNEDAIRALTLAMGERQKKLNAEGAAQENVDATTRQLNASLDELRARMVAAQRASIAQAEGSKTAATATAKATGEYRLTRDELVKASDEGEKFRKKMKDLALEVGRALTTLSNTEFVKEFGDRIPDAMREFKARGTDAANIADSIKAAFDRLIAIELGDWAKKESAELRGLTSEVQVFGAGVLQSAAILEQVQGESIGRTADASRNAATIARETDFARAEAAIESAKRWGASWQQVYAMETALSRRRMEAAIADSRREFKERTQFINRTTTFGETEYQAMATEQQAIERQITDNFRNSERAKREELQVTHDAWRRTYAAMKATAISFKDSVTGNLGTILFGLGNDPTGELKDAAVDAKREYESLKASGKATAEEIGRAFRTWRDAEEKANRTFGERMKDVWRGFKSTVVEILNQLLKHFVESFLVGLIKGMAGAKLGQRFGAMLGGTGGGGGGGVGGGIASGIAQKGIGKLLGFAGIGGGGAATVGGIAVGTGLTSAQMATPAFASLLGANTGAAAGTAGAAGGMGATLTALATNPLTWAAAGGVALAWAIAKKGLFRGGWEGIEGNERRDKHLAQWGKPGTGPTSGFGRLAAFLTQQTGEPGGGSLFKAFMSGDKKRFESSQAAIVSMANKAGKKNIQAFHRGGVIDVPSRSPGLTPSPSPSGPKGTGTGSDDVLIRAQKGEAVLTEAATALIGGRPTIDALNAGQLTGGVFSGIGALLWRSSKGDDTPEKRVPLKTARMAGRAVSFGIFHQGGVIGSGRARMTNLARLAEMRVPVRTGSGGFVGRLNSTREPSTTIIHQDNRTTIQGVLDAASVKEVYRKHILPMQKQAALFNTDGYTRAHRRALEY